MSWSTTAPVQNAVVDVGLDTGYGRTVAAETRAVAGTATNYHHGHLTGPRSRGRPTTTACATTAARPTTPPSAPRPPAPAPFTFTAFGDQGVSAGAQSITARVAAVAPAFHIHAGDICYANNRGLGKPAELNMPDNNVWDVWLSQMTAVGDDRAVDDRGRQPRDGGRLRPAGLRRLPGPLRAAGRRTGGRPSSTPSATATWPCCPSTPTTCPTRSRPTPATPSGAQDAWLRSTLQALRADPGHRLHRRPVPPLRLLHQRRARVRRRRARPLAGRCSTSSPSISSSTATTTPTSGPIR